jgi:TRAP-type mannitol/chloroaromatic compound transport system substrate-binding protein
MQHWWGAGEHWLFEMFQQRIEEMSGGRIVIDQLYWDGGLVPWNETHNALRAGTLDIIFDWGEPWIDTMPVGNVEYISSMLSKNVQQSWVLFGGYSGHGFGFTELMREEYLEKEGVYYIAPHFSDHSTFFLKDPIEKYDDLKGRRLWTSRVLGKIMEKVGMVSVVIPPEELYTSMASGIIDGVEWGGCACGWDMGWHEVAKYVTFPHVLPTVTASYTMMPDTWEALPDDLKYIVEVAVIMNSNDMRTAYRYREQEKLAIMMKDFGVTPIHLPEEEQEYYKELVLQTLDEYMEVDDLSREAGEIVKTWLAHFEGAVQ